MNPELSGGNEEQNKKCHWSGLVDESRAKGGAPIIRLSPRARRHLGEMTFRSKMTVKFPLAAAE